jgi:hypothetical protein
MADEGGRSRKSIAMAWHDAIRAIVNHNVAWHCAKSRDQVN